MKRDLLILWTAIAAMVMCSACNEPVMSEQEATKWIAAYAPERISANSPIRIEFTSKVQPIYSSRALDNVLKFSPRLRGEVRLLSRRSIE
ncbi:MAG: hypothetical protein K2J00_07130, partial [Bacteroidaceae bacterium]|nr:hypothetical protein [Bacteroidaceae bacterium]